MTQVEEELLRRIEETKAFNARVRVALEDIKREDERIRETEEYRQRQRRYGLSSVDGPPSIGREFLYDTLIPGLLSIPGHVLKTPYYAVSLGWHFLFVWPASFVHGCFVAGTWLVSWVVGVTMMALFTVAVAYFTALAIDGEEAKNTPIVRRVDYVGRFVDSYIERASQPIGTYDTEK